MRTIQVKFDTDQPCTGGIYAVLRRMTDQQQVSRFICKISFEDADAERALVAFRSLEHVVYARFVRN